jgi:hypothetical protein
VTAQQSNDAMGAIGASFGIAVGGGLGEGAADAAMDAAGIPRSCKRPLMPFVLPPGAMTGAAVGDYLDLPAQFGPPLGWFWDIVALSAYGFTAGSIAVTKNFPLVTSAGNPYAIEPVGAFSAAGVIAYPQRGIPLLDGTERLVFTVTSALTLAAGQVQFSGQVIAIPAERISEYLS